MTQSNIRSGYQIYDREAKRRRRKNPLVDLYPDLPEDKFDIIYADPPWDYGGKMQFDKSGMKSENPGFEKNVFISAADFKYPTLKTPELIELNVPAIAADDCLLFMWATNPHLAQAIQLGESWGFEYKTVGFVWNKMVHNPGKYTMSYCELCLIFKKGRIPSPRGARNIKQLVEQKRGKHSEKPAAIRDNIVAMFPDQKRIELFARHREPGWTVWGLEAYPEESPLNQEEAEGDHQNAATSQLDLLNRAT